MKNRDYYILDLKNGQYEVYFELAELSRKINKDQRTVKKYLKEGVYETESFKIAEISYIQTKSTRGNPNF